MTDRNEKPRTPNCSLDPRFRPSRAWPHRIKLIGPRPRLVMKLYCFPDPESREMPWVDDPRFGLKDD
jgi:hypothetical protein